MTDYLLEPATQNKTDWHPTHFSMTYEDGSSEETEDFWKVKLLQQAKGKNVQHLRVTMSDGFQVEVDGKIGTVTLNGVKLHFQESGTQWSHDLLGNTGILRRTRSEVLSFNSGMVPAPSYVYAWVFGFSSGNYGRREYQLHPDGTLSYRGSLE